VALAAIEAIIYDVWANRNDESTISAAMAAAGKREPLFIAATCSLVTFAVVCLAVHFFGND
jgi:hypothetical protein